MYDVSTSLGLDLHDFYSDAVVFSPGRNAAIEHQAAGRICRVSIPMNQFADKPLIISRLPKHETSTFGGSV
jgi:hypothetical protein